jgi:CheY-like chemotaxis protein
MSRILLVDDSPHAQRMGERILTEEGFEVVTVSNADSALIRLDDVDPDVVVADTVMPGRTGYEICQYLKMSPRHRHVRVILTAGVLEPLDEAQSKRVEADGILKKPFEASALVAAVKPLAEAAAAQRAEKTAEQADLSKPRLEAAGGTPFVAVVDAEQVRAAVTVALDAAMDTMVTEITRRVLAALAPKKTAETPVAGIAPPSQPEPAPPPPAAPRLESVRRVPLRFRTGSMLGLDLDRGESGTGLPEVPRPASESEPDA